MKDEKIKILTNLNFRTRTEGNSLVLEMYAFDGKQENIKYVEMDLDRFIDTLKKHDHPEKFAIYEFETYIGLLLKEIILR